MHPSISPQCPICRSATAVPPASTRIFPWYGSLNTMDPFLLLLLPQVIRVAEIPQTLHRIAVAIDLEVRPCLASLVVILRLKFVESLDDVGGTMAGLQSGVDNPFAFDAQIRVSVLVQVQDLRKSQLESEM